MSHSTFFSEYNGSDVDHVNLGFLLPMQMYVCMYEHILIRGSAIKFPMSTCTLFTFKVVVLFHPVVNYLMNVPIITE